MSTLRRIVAMIGSTKIAVIPCASSCLVSCANGAARIDEFVAHPYSASLVQVLAPGVLHCRCWGTRGRRLTCVLGMPQERPGSGLRTVRGGRRASSRRMAGKPDGATLNDCWNQVAGCGDTRL